MLSGKPYEKKIISYKDLKKRKVVVYYLLMCKAEKGFR